MRDMPRDALIHARAGRHAMALVPGPVGLAHRSLPRRVHARHASRCALQNTVRCAANSIIDPASSTRSEKKALDASSLVNGTQMDTSPIAQAMTTLAWKTP